MAYKPQATQVCGVNLLGPLDECLLVKVRLWLFTLNGGVERFQILLYVWHCVVCLYKWKRETETGIDWLSSSDNFSLSLPLTYRYYSKTGRQKITGISHISTNTYF